MANGSVDRVDWRTPGELQEDVRLSFPELSTPGRAGLVVRAGREVLQMHRVTGLD